MRGINFYKGENGQEYYNPNVLLQKKDLNGNSPGIFGAFSNRAAGKTTGFLDIFCCDYISDGAYFRELFPECGAIEKPSKVLFLYKQVGEISSAHRIFDDVNSMYHHFEKMTIKNVLKDTIWEIFGDGESIGYSMPISKPTQIKPYRPLFKDVRWIYLDEVQPEKSKGRAYSKTEIQDLMSIIITVSGGGGSQSRKDVKLILNGNNVNMVNPYFQMWNVAKRLKPETKFLRGDNFVLEFNQNESAKKAVSENAIVRALSPGTNYAESMTDIQSFLYNDNKMILEKIPSKSIYLITIIYDGISYGIRECYNDGFLHVSKKIQPNFRYVCSASSNDHDSMLNLVYSNKFATKFMNDYYNNGRVRFEDMDCKLMFLDVLGVERYG